MDVADTNKKTSKFIDWTVFKNKETLTIRGYEENLVVMPSVLFYDNLLSQIAVDANVKRRPTSLAVFLIGGGEQIYTYIQVNKNGKSLFLSSP